jgi:hypothetical protein
LTEKLHLNNEKKYKTNRKVRTGEIRKIPRGTFPHPVTLFLSTHEEVDTPVWKKITTSMDFTSFVYTRPGPKPSHKTRGPSQH